MLLALVEPTAARAHLSRFDVTQDATGFRIDASADLDADLALVWDTLTDYEKLPEFVPGIRRVRVLETHDDGSRKHLLIEQAGELRFLFFSRRIAVLLDVEQEPQSRVEARALPRPPANPDEASLHEFEGTYTLVPIPGGVRLGYRARFAPEFTLPPILGALAVRRTMRAQFEAMLAEIYRRNLAAAPHDPVR